MNDKLGQKDKLGFSKTDIKNKIRTQWTVIVRPYLVTYHLQPLKYYNVRIWIMFREPLVGIYLRVCVCVCVCVLIVCRHTSLSITKVGY